MLFSSVKLAGHEQMDRKKEGRGGLPSLLIYIPDLR